MVAAITLSGLVLLSPTDKRVGVEIAFTLYGGTTDRKLSLFFITIPSAKDDVIAIADMIRVVNVLICLQSCGWVLFLTGRYYIR